MHIFYFAFTWLYGSKSTCVKIGNCSLNNKHFTNFLLKITDNFRESFDSWKCQLLCNKMSKVENSCKPRLITILKQHHFNVNSYYSCKQNLNSVHMNRFAYMQNLRICNLKFVLGLSQVQISRICMWCKFCIRVQIHSHGQICKRE